MKYIELHWTLHPRKNVGMYRDQDTGKPRSPWYDNEIVNKKMSPSAVARELDLSDELSVEGVVYPQFSGYHIMHGEYEINPYLPVIRVFDYGKFCACLFLQKDSLFRIRAFKEIVLEGSGTRELGLAAMRYTSTLPSGLTFKDYDDPSGKYELEKGELSKRTMLREVSNGSINPTSNRIERYRDIDIGVDLIKFHLSNRTEGEEDIKISKDGCPILVDAFQSGYRYKEDYAGNITDIIEEIHPYEDVMDCMRYACVEELEIYDPNKLDARDFRPRRKNKYTGR